ncbi:MAG: A24 family peptidase [Gemmatimonadetes bacterium]|nr:A24 family peptidase [Gemmatimonadota bacterium]
MDIQLWRLVVLFGLSAAAAAYDIAFRRIPNWLTSAGLLLGLGLAALVGASEAAHRLLAALLVLSIGLLLHRRRILGGGDVKLLVAVAAIVGVELLPRVFVFAALAGAGIAFAEAYRRGLLLPLMLDARDAAVYYATFGRRGQRPPRTREQFTVPYAVAIGIGALAAWLL